MANLTHCMPKKENKVKIVEHFSKGIRFLRGFFVPSARRAQGTIESFRSEFTANL